MLRARNVEDDLPREAIAGRGEEAGRELGLKERTGAICLDRAHSLLRTLLDDQNDAARNIESVVKKFLSTAPMLMYQHSRSGVSSPGR
jgi:hypothetical protein